MSKITKTLVDALAKTLESIRTLPESKERNRIAMKIWEEVKKTDIFPCDLYIDDALMDLGLAQTGESGCVEYLDYDFSAEEILEAREFFKFSLMSSPSDVFGYPLDKLIDLLEDQLEAYKVTDKVWVEVELNSRGGYGIIYVVGYGKNL